MSITSNRESHFDRPQHKDAVSSGFTLVQVAIPSESYVMLVKRCERLHRPVRDVAALLLHDAILASESRSVTGDQHGG